MRRRASNTRIVGLSPAGAALATGVGAALASLFCHSPKVKQALADTAAACFRATAAELKREREGQLPPGAVLP